jgi:hypothetical protein
VLQMRRSLCDTYAVKATSPDSLLDTYHRERHPIAAPVLRLTMAQTALARGGDRTEALREAMADPLQMDEPRKPGLSEGRKHDRMRSTLVITEIALACVLLVGAGLLLRSFLHVLDIDLGFEASHAAAISVDYVDGGNAAKRAAIWQDVTSRSLMIPGVESAGISDNLPMSRNSSWGIAAKGEQKRDALDYVPVFVYIVSPGYLKAMGMRLLEGRDLNWDDVLNFSSRANWKLQNNWHTRSCLGLRTEV